MTPEQAIPHAARLVCGVAERNPEETHAVLLALDADELRTLAVVLAASVDPDRPLGGLPIKERSSQLVGRITLAVTIRTGIDVPTIYGRDRRTAVVEARALVCWIATELDVGPTDIGRALGLHHSTVIHATSKVINDPSLMEIGRGVLADLQQEAT